MSGDYSRIAFDPELDDLGVLWEQGRPFTDRDVNDFVLQSIRRTQAGTLDTIGPEAVPEETKDGFKIAASGGSLTIGRGRAYVDGLLAENHGAAPSGGMLSWDPHLAELYGSEPLDYKSQPYDPDPLDLPKTNGPHLVYLDVWEREVTHLMREGLVDSAIGVDTTTRLQTVWQVKVLADVGTGVECSTPLDQVPGWLPQNAHSAGRLTSDTATVPGQPDPCQVPPKSGYKGQENQLYRVEIQKKGPPGTATFKWSRDNASIETRVTEIPSSTELVVESIGRDDVLCFSDGDWVEIIDDWLELHNQPGVLRHIKVGGGVDVASRTITLDLALPAGIFVADPARHTRIRRWDQKGKIYDGAGNVIQDLDATLPPPEDGIVVPTGGKQVLLEQGIVVSFGVEPASGEFRSGDWWVFAARAGEGTIEKLKDAPPRGIHHHYAHLGLWDPSTDTVTNCRVPWPPHCGGCCSVTVAPDESIQEALDSLPTEGGCVCLKTGVHEITQPIKILGSKIVLRGESPGAIVHSTSPSLLVIGDLQKLITDVKVAEIRFEAGPPLGTPPGGIVQLIGCSRVCVERCQFAGTPSEGGANAGALLSGVTDVVFRDNRVDGLTFGVIAKGYIDTLDVSANHLEGLLSDPTDTGKFGSAGVYVEGAAGGMCRVERNLIRNFAVGVQVGEDAEGCVIAENTILRDPVKLDDKVPMGLTELGAYLNKRDYAIDLSSGSCEVRGNRIDLRSAAYGGVKTDAMHVKILDNVLESPEQKKPGLVPLPASIYCLADMGGAAHHAEIAGNRLLGPQVGIALFGVDDAAVSDNHCEGGWFGIVADQCTGASIRDNDLSEVLFGISLGEGLQNRLLGNEVHDTLVGIMADGGGALSAEGNDLYNCVLFGAVLLVKDSTAFLNNRVVRCAYAGASEVGVFVFDSMGGPPGAMLRVEDCELVDIGISAKGGAGVGTAWGLAARVHSCEIVGNHIGYAGFEPVLPPDDEHRALLLAGPIIARSEHRDIAGNIVIDYAGTLSSALIVDNQFRGPGRTSLVELLSLTDANKQTYMYERVTFSNNACEHWTRKSAGEAVTVQLRGAYPSVMGNHVKGPQHVHSISLGGPPRGTIMGNVATGDYIQLGGAIPTPAASFNVTLP